MRRFNRGWLPTSVSRHHHFGFTFPLVHRLKTAPFLGVVLLLKLFTLTSAISSCEEQHSKIFLKLCLNSLIRLSLCVYSVCCMKKLWPKTTEIVAVMNHATRLHVVKMYKLHKCNFVFKLFRLLFLILICALETVAVCDVFRVMYEGQWVVLYSDSLIVVNYIFWCWYRSKF